MPIDVPDESLAVPPELSLPCRSVRSRSPTPYLRVVLSMAVGAVAIVGPSSPVAHAQAGTEEVARRLVREGIEDARQRDWINARERFQAAYDIQPLPLTLYNLATAQEKTGLLIEADRSYRIFLTETSPGDNDEFRRIAVERRRALRSRIAHLVIEVENLAADDVLRIGDKVLAHAIVGRSIPCNPGILTVSVERRRRRLVQQSVSLAEGGTQVLKLRVEPVALPKAVMPVPPPPAAEAATQPPAETVAATATSTEEDDDGGLLSSAWFWSVLGIVVVGGAAAGGFLLFSEDARDPYRGDVSLEVN